MVFLHCTQHIFDMHQSIKLKCACNNKHGALSMGMQSILCRFLKIELQIKKKKEMKCRAHKRWRKCRWNHVRSEKWEVTLISEQWATIRNFSIRIHDVNQYKARLVHWNHWHSSLVLHCHASVQNIKCDQWSWPQNEYWDLLLSCRHSYTNNNKIKYEFVVCSIWSIVHSHKSPKSCVIPNRTPLGTQNYYFEKN